MANVEVTDCTSDPPHPDPCPAVQLKQCSPMRILLPNNITSSIELMVTGEPSIRCSGNAAARLKSQLYNPPSQPTLISLLHMICSVASGFPVYGMKLNAGQFLQLFF
jgi:hypothetical protein